MPFCSKCGTEVSESGNFCQKCGNALQVGQSSNTSTEATKSIFGERIGPPNLSYLSDKWVWTLACVPIFGMILSAIIMSISGYDSEYLALVVFVILNITFLTLDIKELEKNAFKLDGWLWLGIILVPVYLFVRASKTNKKYGYAITWCVLFVLSLILEG